MDIAKIRNLSDEELKTEQAKAGEQIFRIRFQKSLGNQEGVKNLRSLKLDVARMKTIERDRELASARESGSIKEGTVAPSQRSPRKSANKAKS